MPAPRLLDKKLVSASLAVERKNEIDKGIKLAKAIDALRQSKAEEEDNLERFRSETVRRVQIEIDSLVIRRDELRSEVQKLQLITNNYGRS